MLPHIVKSVRSISFICHVASSQRSHVILFSSASENKQVIMTFSHIQAEAGLAVTHFSS